MDDVFDGEAEMHPLATPGRSPHKPHAEGGEGRTLIDVRRELNEAAGGVNSTDEEEALSTTSGEALKAVEAALARQVTTKKLSLRQLTVTNQGLGLLERAMEELRIARDAAKDGEEALELVWHTLRRAAQPGSDGEVDVDALLEEDCECMTKAEKARKMILLVGELAAERDRALEAASLSSEKIGGATKADASLPSTSMQTRKGTGKRQNSLNDMTDIEPNSSVKHVVPKAVETNVKPAGAGAARLTQAASLSSTPTTAPTKGGVARLTADTTATAARGLLSMNNDADWAQTASAPPPAIPVTAAKLRELAAVAERAEAVGSTSINLTHVLDSLVVTPLSAHPPAVITRGPVDSPDEMSDVLTRVASIVRVMSNPDTGRVGAGAGAGAGGDSEADELVAQVLELVAQLDAARRSAEDVAVAARADVAAMRAEVAVAWEALGTPHATPTQSSVERFAEELEALLQEKDAVTAVAAQEIENKRRAIVASAEAQRQLVLQTSARARAESALRSAHEQVEGLKRHARELADLNQSSRQQVAAERRLVQRLKNETKQASDREEKERRRADSTHAEAHKLRSGLTARTREAFRNAEAARQAREEAERERGVNQLLRAREQKLESKVCELANAVAQQAQAASVKSQEKAHAAVTGTAVRELEVMVQELAHEEIRSRRRAAEAEAASKAAKEATADALSQVAALRAEVSTLENRISAEANSPGKFLLGRGGRGADELGRGAD